MMKDAGVLLTPLEVLDEPDEDDDVLELELDEPPELELVELLELDDPPELELVELLELELDEVLELELVLVDVEVDVLDATAKMDVAGLGMANVLCLPTASDWISKSKSTPMNSKNVSLTVMNRTSIET
jgi:hypothetical protein